MLNLLTLISESARRVRGYVDVPDHSFLTATLSFYLPTWSRRHIADAGLDPVVRVTVTPSDNVRTYRRF
jgi:hypothetical protein